MVILMLLEVVAESVKASETLWTADRKLCQALADSWIITATKTNNQIKAIKCHRIIINFSIISQIVANSRVVCLIWGREIVTVITNSKITNSLASISTKILAVITLVIILGPLTLLNQYSDPIIIITMLANNSNSNSQFLAITITKTVRITTILAFSTRIITIRITITNFKQIIILEIIITVVPPIATNSTTFSILILIIIIIISIKILMIIIIRQEVVEILNNNSTMCFRIIIIKGRIRIVITIVLVDSILWISKISKIPTKDKDKIFLGILRGKDVAIRVKMIKIIIRVVQYLVKWIIIIIITIIILWGINLSKIQVIVIYLVYSRVVLQMASESAAWAAAPYSAI